MGGGPDKRQTTAADSTAALSGKLSSQGDKAQAITSNVVSPFYQDRATNGLPYYNNLVDATSGTVAQAFAPARAAQDRRLGVQPGLPSGFKEGARADLDEAQAGAFDQGAIQAQQMQEEAKQRGIQGLADVNNPMPYYSGAMGGNQAIMNANLRKPGLGGVLGGVAGGLASAIPF